MPNPLFPQGTLNRLRASVIWQTFPELNVTAAFLGEEGIRLALEGESTAFIETLTGAVTSPNPYMPVTLGCHLLKSQALANAYKNQMEDNALLGDGTVRPDASTLDPYGITNCAIQGVRELVFNGKDAGWYVTIKGFYITNNSLWDA